MKKLSFFALFFAFLLIGCVTPRVNPLLKDMRLSGKSILMLPIETNVYEVSAGGIAEKKDDWETEIKNNVVSAIKEELANKQGSTLKILDPIPSDEKDLSELRALFSAVNTSIRIYTYSDNPFQERIDNFDYSLGPEVKAVSGGSDLILFIDCFSRVPTLGRHIENQINAFLGSGISHDNSLIQVALVDSSSGSILWYFYALQPSSHSNYLMDKATVTAIVRRIFEDFPVN